MKSILLFLALASSVFGLTGADSAMILPNGGSVAQTAATLTTVGQDMGWKGYTLFAQALTSSPTDAQTIYFGSMPSAPTATAATRKIYIPKAGTIKRVDIYSFSGTAGTNEAWVMYVRLNNTTDTQIASVSLAIGERIWSNASLSIAVAAGDYIEIKSVNPTWATNPLTFIPAGFIYIEYNPA